MTYEQQRAQLVAQAQEHINNGEVDKAKEIMNRINDLDAKHEQTITAQANLDALNGSHLPAANPAQLAGTAQGVLLTDELSAEPADDMYNTLEYRRAFMQNILTETPIPAKFRNENQTTTSATAGSIVPTTLYQKIVVKLEEYGEIYARVFKTFFPTALVIPTSSVKPVATWVDEDKGSDRQKLTPDKLVFSGYKLECKVSLSLFMSVTSLEIFEEQFVNLIAEAMYLSMEGKMVSGSGTGCPKGILLETPPTGQALTVAAGANGKLTYQTILDMEAALPAAYKNAVWLMTKKTFIAFMGITDDNGQPIARINAGLSDAQEYVLNGRHVVLTDGYMGSFAPTVTSDTIVAALFDLGFYVWNEVMGMMMKRYIDDDTDEVILKAVMLADGKVIDKNSLVTLTKKAS